MSTDRWYRLKKALVFYPGLKEPVCADVLLDYYCERQQQRTALQAMVDSAVATAFLAIVPLRAWQVRRRYGLDRDWQSHAVRIARERFADPNDIALFEVTRAEEFRQLVRRFEYAALSKRFNPAGWRPDCALSDKWRFHQRCLLHDLPVPGLVAQRRSGVTSVCGQPAGDLILKPAGGTGGQGVQLLVLPCHSAGSARDCESALVSWLTDQIPAHGDWLVQERLFNHDRLRSIAMNALSTTRITTMLDEHGSAEVVAAVQRLPLDATTCIDNTSGGGLIAGIDEKSGQLLPAKLGRSRGDLGRRYAVHPLSGSAIAGVELPFWGQCLELARHAHAAAFREYTMVGWDVGITNSGPVLIEGNGKPSIVINQRGTGRAAGDGRLGELLRYHLARTIHESS